jgi:hypothetical protein
MAKSKAFNQLIQPEFNTFYFKIKPYLISYIGKENISSELISEIFRISVEYYFQNQETEKLQNYLITMFIEKEKLTIEFILKFVLYIPLNKIKFVSAFDRLLPFLFSELKNVKELFHHSKICCILKARRKVLPSEEVEYLILKTVQFILKSKNLDVSQTVQLLRCIDFAVNQKNVMSKNIFALSVFENFMEKVEKSFAGDVKSLVATSAGEESEEEDNEAENEIKSQSKDDITPEAILNV